MGPTCKHIPPTLVVKARSAGHFRHSEDEWYCDHEDDLIDIWHAVQDSINERGIVMLNECRFDQFCTFVLSMTTTRRDRCI